MEAKRVALQTQIAALSVIIVVLAGGFAYYYVSTSNQVSSVKAACRWLLSTGSELQTFIDNLTQVYASQIRSDTLLIQTLNSTKPAGYVGMIATLNSQIKQDFQIQDEISNLEGPGISSGPVIAPCNAFIQP